MSGVGSTNAMKKGSANNPFLAYSEADMQGFLNSAYTGCIVKYTGPAINRTLSEQNKTVPDYAQNLVFNRVNYGWPAFYDGNVKFIITEKTNEGTNTWYLAAGKYINGAWDFSRNGAFNGDVVLTNSLGSNPTSIRKLWTPKDKWNNDYINDQGNLTFWTYDKDAVFTIAPIDNNDIDYTDLTGITIVPYKVNELYKVVYGSGEYYYEEFCHISNTPTTANSDYMAPGKTAFDFTGNLQTGNGSKINPYLASTADEMAAYLTSSYKGAFVKYVGDTVAVGGTPAPVNPIAVGDILQSTAAGDEGHPILYLNTNITPDFSQFPDEQLQNEGGYSLLDVLEGSNPSSFLTAHKASQGNDTVYMLAVSQTPIYAFSETMSPSIMQLEHWGWIYSSPFTVERWGGEAKVSSVNQQDVWGAYISKDGQWTSGGGESYVKNAIYQVAEDGDTTMYMILPTLSNPGTAADLAQGKQLIDGEGKVVEGAAPTQGDILALYANKQLTEFITDAEISSIGISYATSYINMSSFTLAYQSLLSKVVLTNVKTLYPDAFTGCSNLTHIELPSDVNLNGVHYFNGNQTNGTIFPSTLWYSSTDGTFINIANWSKYDVLLSARMNKSNYSSAKYILAGALASSNTRQSIVYLSGAISVNSYLGGSYGNNAIKTIYMPNCSNVIRYTFNNFSYLDTIYLDNAISIGNAFYYCSRLKKVYCPNVESLEYAFISSPNLTEPYDFPNVKYCVYPYSSSLSAISSVNLPEASVVKLSGSGIQSIYMPKVENLALVGVQLSNISVPYCRELYLNNMSNLESIYAPNLLYCSTIANCYKLTEINFESVIAASSSYTYSPYTFSISNCSQLKTISLPNFSIGGIYIGGCSNLEKVYAPLLNSYISISNCTLTQFSIYNAYSVSFYSVTAKSDFSIYANESTFSYLYLGISAKNSEHVDLYINNYSRSAYLGVNSISSNAIRNINISVHDNSLRGALYAGEHINIYNTYPEEYVLQMYLSNNSTVLDVKLSNCCMVDYFCYNCSNLEDVYNNEVSYMYGYTYNNCSKLSTIIMNGSNVVLINGTSIFSNTPITNSTYLGYYGSIYVPNSMVDKYKTTTYWKSYASRITSITDLPQELKDKYGLNGVE